MTQVTSGYVDVDGGKLYYEAAGEGDTLVLCHAGFVDSRMWDDQWGAFTQRYHVIRFDMRGFGKSDPAEAPIDRRDDLHRLLEQLKVTRATFLGCSMSGEIMLDYALTRPETVAALVVVSAVPSGFELQGQPPPHLMEMMGAIETGDLDLASELQNRIWVDGPFRRPEEVNPRVRQRAAAMNQIALANETWRKVDLMPLNPLDPPAAGRLHEVCVPTLVITGGLDHPEILRAAEVMTAVIPDAGKETIPDCAHLPNMEKPAAFNRIVLDFLQNLN